MPTFTIDPENNITARAELPENVSNGFCLAEEGAMYLVGVKGGPYNVWWFNAQNTRDVRRAPPVELALGGQTRSAELASPEPISRFIATRDRCRTELTTARLLRTMPPCERFLRRTPPLSGGAL
jgi:hypothetical protein